MDKENKNLLIIFTRNMILGKCKTRLANAVGPHIALDIYRFLVGHTAEISKDLSARKWVFYSEYTEKDDLFKSDSFEKFVQEGDGLGSRMNRAFNTGFDLGFENIIIIGSDMYDLNSADIERAFDKLEESDYVIGPASDGGYYLLGMKAPTPGIFENKDWGTSTVLAETLDDLKTKNVKLLDERNDVDVIEDIQDVPAFQRYLNDIK